MKKEDLYKQLFSSLQSSREFFKKLLFVVTASFVLIMVYAKFELDTRERYEAEIKLNQQILENNKKELTNLYMWRYLPEPEYTEAEAKHRQLIAQRSKWRNGDYQQKQIIKDVAKLIKKNIAPDDMPDRLSNDYSSELKKTAIKSELVFHKFKLEFEAIKQEHYLKQSENERAVSRRVKEIKAQNSKIPLQNKQHQKRIDEIDNLKTNVPGLGVALRSQHVLPMIPAILGILIFICISREMEYLALLNKPGMQAVLDTMRQERLQVFYYDQTIYGILMRNAYLILAILLQQAALGFALAYELEVPWLWEISTLWQYMVQYLFAIIPLLYLFYYIHAHKQLSSEMEKGGN